MPKLNLKVLLQNKKLSAFYHYFLDKIIKKKHY